MRFKVTLFGKPKYNVPVTCVGWSSTEEIYSAGADEDLQAWSVSTGLSTKIAHIQDLLPTDMQFYSRVSGTLGKHGDLILITSADGKFHVLNRSGRIDRSVEAHKGAILVGQWSNDGTSLLTAGEDGLVKIWSKSGMLRSTIASNDSSVYGACWSPDSQAIAYTNGKFIVIKQLAPNTKPLRWKAHESLVLCLGWSAASEFLVSGGEDCRYRVWDNQGRQMFSSLLHDHPIMSISWSPGGEIFAVGSYNTLRLCDFSGWSRSLEKPNTGCIYKMSWSADGTQLTGACANGQILFAHLVERNVQFLRFMASVRDKKLVTVTNILDDTTEQLEPSERVIQLALRYDHLVLTTPSQCYIYNTNNWNVPIIFDLNGGSVIFLVLCEKHMLLVEKSAVGIYNYQGRLISSPRWPNIRLDNLRSSHISLSSDALAVRDSEDKKLVHIFRFSTNKMSTESNSIHHSMQIVQVSLEQSAEMGHLVILDKNKDLYLIQLGKLNEDFLKLGSKIESFQYNANNNFIAAIQDDHLIIWYCPFAAFNSHLFKLCSRHYDSAELGRSPRIHDFVGNSVFIRKSDGSLLTVPISPFPSTLHKYMNENKWTDALNLCRSLNDVTSWACLAVLSTQSKYEFLDIAEEAFANINHHDKVLYIQFLKSLPSQAEQRAHMASLGGRNQEAETLLLHNGKVFQALYLNIELNKWNRALDIALKHKAHVDAVLYLRKKYLEKLGKPETNDKFSSLEQSVSVDEESVLQKITVETEGKPLLIPLL